MMASCATMKGLTGVYQSNNRSALSLV